MKTLKHPVVGLILFVVLATLCITIYKGLETNYGVTETNTATINGSSGNIMEHLGDISIISTVNEFSISIRKIVAPKNVIDILGGLAGVAIGSLNLIWDIFTFPLQIMNIILSFYDVPGIIITGLNVIIFVYVAFLILSAYLGRDI